VAALTNAVHANAATARLEAFIVFLLWVRAATINDSPDHPIDLDQGSGSKKPREEAFGHFRAIGAWPSRVARSYLAGLIEAASFDLYQNCSDMSPVRMFIVPSACSGLEKYDEHPLDNCHWLYRWSDCQVHYAWRQN
jgi:hypothetical protein